MNISEELIGKRIVLRKPERTEALASAIYQSVKRSKEAFIPWLGWAEKYESIDSAYDFIDFCLNGWESKEQFPYLIFKDNVFVGVITVLHIANNHNRAEIGYWQDVKHCGNGYIQEAVCLVEKEFFNNGFNKLIIHTDILNEKSANIAKKLGYVHEGVLREQIYAPTIGRYRSQNVFSKLKSEWDKIK